MLPFLKPKKISSVIIAKRNASGSATPVREEGEATPEMHQHMSAFLDAVNSKDVAGMASAMEAAHNHLMDSQKPDGDPA